MYCHKVSTNAADDVICRAVFGAGVTKNSDYFPMQHQCHRDEACLPRGTSRIFNPLAQELDIYSLAHHLCKM